MIIDTSHLAIPKTDTRTYRVIKLHNGLTALLVSEKTTSSNPSSDSTEADDSLPCSQSSTHCRTGSKRTQKQRTSSYRSTRCQEWSLSVTTQNLVKKRRISADSGVTTAVDSNVTDVNDCNDDSTRAAVSLCVKVGSMSDPTDVPGLAHLLEHMLFLGTSKYPDESEFDRFLKQHGGSSNAHTDNERTSFHFDIQHNHLRTALDRFSQFFMTPLLKENSIIREIEAVDSEFTLNQQCDRFRLEQLLASMAATQHPMSKFMCGNKESLCSAGVDIKKALANFFEEHYVAQNMTLAVLAHESLDTLERWVEEIFSSIKSSCSEAPDFSQLGNPFDTESFRKLYKVVPVLNIQQVHITWSLPNMMTNYRSRPMCYYGWLIEHEGRGSIMSALRVRNWALGIQCGNNGSGHELNSSWACFSVQITLTEEGFEHIVDVIRILFQYIKMLQKHGPDIRVFNEIQTIDGNEFEFRDPSDPQEYIHTLSCNMQLYSVEDYVQGGEVFVTYQPELLKTVLKYLEPSSCNVLILSKRYETTAQHKEKWYSTRYAIEDVPVAWRQSWTDVTTNHDLHMPDINGYIATDFTLKPIAEEHTEPHIISESSICRTWYLQDNVYKVPRAYIDIYLCSAYADRTASSKTMMDLFVSLLERQMLETIYPAEVAQISCKLDVVENGFTIRLGGFNNKLESVFRLVVDHLKYFTLDSAELESVKSHWQNVYYNLAISAEHLNKEVMDSVLVQNMWTVRDKSCCLSAITLETFDEFYKSLFTAMCVKILIQGNITAEEAFFVENYLTSALNIQPFIDEQLPENHAKLLPIGQSNHAIKNANMSDATTVIGNFYQLQDVNERQAVLLDILVKILDQPSFEYLRTKRQLGYVVSVSSEHTHGLLGFCVNVCSQADKYTYVIHCLYLISENSDSSQVHCFQV